MILRFTLCSPVTGVVSMTESGLFPIRDLTAGILIGAVNESWWVVFALCIVWGFISWWFISISVRRMEYKLVPRLPFGSVALSRFTVRWTTGFAVSLLSASLTIL